VGLLARARVDVLGSPKGLSISFSLFYHLGIHWNGMEWNGLELLSHAVGITSIIVLFVGAEGSVLRLNVVGKRFPPCKVFYIQEHGAVHWDVVVDREKSGKLTDPSYRRYTSRRTVEIPHPHPHPHPHWMPRATAMQCNASFHPSSLPSFLPSFQTLRSRPVPVFQKKLVHLPHLP
jgi:hypothetical protein